MGRGSKTSQTRVKKERSLDSEMSQGGGGSGGGKGDKPNDCIFSFSDKITISTGSSKGIKKLSPVVLVTNGSGQKTDVYINGMNFGEYKGHFAQKVLECTKKRYVYEGTVENITNISGGTTIRFSVHGQRS